MAIRDRQQPQVEPDVTVGAAERRELGATTVAGKMNWPNGDYLCFSQRNIAHLHHLFQGSLYLHQGGQYHGQLQFKSPTVVSREGTGTHYFPNGHRVSGFWKNNLIQWSRPTQNIRNTQKQNTQKNTHGSC